MAERHIKAIQKILDKGIVYLRIDSKYYTLVEVEIKGSEATINCRDTKDNRELKVGLKINGQLLQDLLGFGLRDRKGSIFIISIDENEAKGFETSVEDLTIELNIKELRKDIRRRLTEYQDIEEPTED